MDRNWAPAELPRHQMTLFAQSLDDCIPLDHPVRLVWDVLEHLDWSNFEQSYPNRRGRPPIHPMFVAGGIVYGLMRGICSSRALEDAARERLDFIWLLERRTIDHSTFALFRKRFQQELKELNTQVVRILVERSESTLETVILDGTRIRANSDRHGARTAKALEKLIAQCIETLHSRLVALAQADELDSGVEEEEQLAFDSGQVGAVQEAKASQEPAPAASETSYEGKAKRDSQVAKLEKKLAKLTKALEVAKARDRAKDKEKRKDSHAVRVPVTDPDAVLIPNKDGGYAPNYTPVAAVDAASGAIVAHDVVEGAAEASCMDGVIDQVRALKGDSPSRLLADTGFASGENLEKLNAAEIDIYMPTGTDFRTSNPANRPDPRHPVPEETRARLPLYRGKLARTAFIYDDENDCYWCPMGNCVKRLRQARDSRTGTRYTQYQCPGKAGCPLAAICINDKPAARMISRDVYQYVRDDVGRHMATNEGQAIYRTRAPGIEGAFGNIKHTMGIRHFKLRGLHNVRTEWTWVCFAYNLRKLLAQTKNKIRRTINQDHRRQMRFVREYAHTGTLKQFWKHRKPTPQASWTHRVAA